MSQLKANTRRATRRLLCVATVALLAAVTLGEGTASAWQYSAASGSPGVVTRTPVISALDQQGLRFLGDTGPVVGRSPATNGTQNVTVVYSFQRWTGSGWVQHAQQMVYATLGSGQSTVRTPYMNMVPTSILGYSRVVIGIHWAVPGRNLGGSVIEPQQGDHRCVTRARYCSVGPGWIFIG